MKRLRLITLASATFTIAGLGFAACTATKLPDVGGLMVIVSTDGKLEVDTLEVTVSQNTRTSERTTRSYASKTFTLPNTIAVVSNGDPTTTAFVRVTARNKLGTVVDIRDTVVQEVPTERLAALSTVLSVSCSGKVTPAGESSCLEGETCDPRSGACKSAIVTAGSLGTYVAGSELDAGVDSTVDVGDSNLKDTSSDTGLPLDMGGVDTLVDGAVDSTVGDTVSVDTGAIDTSSTDGACTSSATTWPPAPGCPIGNHAWRCWPPVAMDTATRTLDFTVRTLCGDDVVSDKATKLMWARNEEVLTRGVEWEAAKALCTASRRAGFADWRLPTRVELQSIVDYQKTTAPTIYAAFLGATGTTQFWSSSPHALIAGAWYVGFGGGGGGIARGGFGASLAVRCVR